MKLTQLILFISFPFLSYSQANFKSIYEKGEQHLFSSYDSCINSVNRAEKLPNLSVIQQIKIDLLEAEAKCQLLSIDSSKIILDNCLKRLSKVKGNNEILWARILLLQGSINSSNSNVQEGIPQLMEALDILQKSEDADLRDYCSIKLAEAHRVKKQFKIGFSILYETLSHTNISARNRAYAYSRLAAYYNESNAEKVYSRSAVDDSIGKYSNLSRLISQKYDFKDFVALSYNELGLNILHLNESCDTAINYLNKSIDIFKKLSYNIDYVNASNNLTWAYLKKGEFEKAIATGKHLLAIRTGEEYPQIYRKTYQFLSDAHDSIGDFRLAKKYLKRVYEIEKNLFKTYMNKEVTALSTKYNYQLKEAQLAEEAHKSHFRLTLFIGTFVITIILLIVAIVVNRLRKMMFIQKQQLLKNKNTILQNNIIHHNKTLTMNALRFVQNDQLLTDILNRLSKVEYLKATDVKEFTQKIISEIRVSKKNEIWNDFVKSFQEVHADFYKNITKEYSDLSAKELRLCAFLKLNLTSKEIAAINRTSLRAVETARHRLRKKLDVSEETDLNSFFQRF